MYKISVPMMNRLVTEKTREDYLKILKEAECDRVFLCYRNGEDLIRLKENVEYFKKNGFESCVWVGETIGHGGALLNSHENAEKETFTPLVNLDGNAIEGTCCPLDPHFIETEANMLKGIAECKPEIIMLDDDFRLSQHGRVHCCACERHLEMINRECGENVTREQLKASFVGKKNKYRDAWLKVQSESLYGAAKALRRAVDEIDDSIPIALCSVYCHRSLDNVDLMKITDIFAGKGKKLLRLHGAPYWAAISNDSLIGVIEISRMFASFVTDGSIETMAEGDVYPRPRYNVPSSYLEIFDMAMRLDGNCDGILKYMVDYSANTDFENGYLKQHKHNLTTVKKISESFGDSANIGVKILTKPNILGDAELSPNIRLDKHPYPTAGILLSTSGIPTVYSNDGGYCSAAFGECAEFIDPTDIKKGCLLDSVSAKILSEKGIDTGIDRFLGASRGNITFIVSEKTKNHAAMINSDTVYSDAELKDSAEIVLRAIVNGAEKPFAYRYENCDGQRFFVYLIEYGSLDKNSGIYKCYEQQTALIDAVEWISGKALPVKCIKNPSLYLMCREEKGSLSVGFFNCSPDPVLELEIMLGERYSRVECIGCEAELNGYKAVFTSEVGAYKFVLLKFFEE